MIPDSEFAELVNEVVELRREVAMLKKDTGASLKIGTVSDLDPIKGFRLQFSTDESHPPRKTAWIAHPEQGGESKTWMPLWKGQVVGFLSPPGDTRKGWLLRQGFCDQYPQPSQDLEEVFLIDYGDSRIRIVRDRITITSPHIELNGKVYLGGLEIDCTRPVSAEGTIDTSNDRDVDNFLIKVWGR